MADDIEAESKKAEMKQPKTQQPVQQPAPQNPLVQIVNSINAILNRLQKVELEMVKIKADIEIAEKDRGLLHKKADFAMTQTENK